MAHRISKSQLRAKISRAQSQIRQAEAKFRRAQTQLKTRLRQIEASERRLLRSLQQLQSTVRAAQRGQRLIVYSYEWHALTVEEQQVLAHCARTRDLTIEIVED